MSVLLESRSGYTLNIQENDFSIHVSHELKEQKPKIGKMAP